MQQMCHTLSKKMCISMNIKITKSAQGLPVGGEIESLDDGTLFSALDTYQKF